MKFEVFTKCKKKQKSLKTPELIFPVSSATSFEHLQSKKLPWNHNVTKNQEDSTSYKTHLKTETKINNDAENQKMKLRT